MTLNEWQQRLERHFAVLKTQRAEQGGNHPIFALEHGLSTDEVASLSSEIKNYIRQAKPASRHWLVWTVYASEIGYSYSGNEYWQTFADRTPAWQEQNQNQARDWIRDAFYDFHRKFDGAKPSGPWAEQFSIICWPIAHAILPQDLQRQLAQVLYEIRHAFTPALLQSPELLGAQIDAHSWDARSRFRKLAEEHLLVGQIAAALLMKGSVQNAGLILPVTLQRIATDLDRNRRSREWLKDAQRRASTVHLRGLHRGFVDGTVVETDSELNEPEARRTVIELGIEPTLVLRRADSYTWNVRLQLPDLSGLLRRFPEFRNVLANERCVVAGLSS